MTPLDELLEGAVPGRNHCSSATWFYDPTLRRTPFNPLV